MSMRPFRKHKNVFTQTFKQTFCAYRYWDFNVTEAVTWIRYAQRMFADPGEQNVFDHVKHCCRTVAHWTVSHVCHPIQCVCEIFAGRWYAQMQEFVHARMSTIGCHWKNTYKLLIPFTEWWGHFVFAEENFSRFSRRLWILCAGCKILYFFRGHTAEWTTKFSSYSETKHQFSTRSLGQNVEKSVTRMLGGTSIENNCGAGEGPLCAAQATTSNTKGRF